MFVDCIKTIRKCSSAHNRAGYQVNAAIGRVAFVVFTYPDGFAKRTSKHSLFRLIDLAAYASPRESLPIAGLTANTLSCTHTPTSEAWAEPRISLGQRGLMNNSASCTSPRSSSPPATIRLPSSRVVVVWPARPWLSLVLSDRHASLSGTYSSILLRTPSE